MESELWPLLEQLQDDIADISDALKPLIKTPLLENAAKLPLVDKAKLYVLTTYALESLLFAYLELNGINPKEHPVMKELTRVKQYFNKIKEAEAKTAGGSSSSSSGQTQGQQQTLTLDKGAAGRFIKNALAGNDEYDRRRAEDLARQKANAHIKFNELGEPIPAAAAQAAAQKSPQGQSGSGDEEEKGELAVHHGTAGTETGASSGLNDEEGEDDEEDEDSDSDSSPAQTTPAKSPKSPKSPGLKKELKKKKKEAKKEKKEKRKARRKEKEEQAKKKQKKSDKSSSD